MKKTTIKIKMPFVYNVRDYHELMGLACTLKELTNENFRYKELDGNKYGTYWGVFYVGKCPSSEEIDKLMGENE